MFFQPKISRWKSYFQLLILIVLWHIYYSLYRKTAGTLETISGMFIASWSIICKMKPQKIKDKPQQGSVTTLYETLRWLFLIREIWCCSWVYGKDEGCPIYRIHNRSSNWRFVTCRDDRSPFVSFRNKSAIELRPTWIGCIGHVWERLYSGIAEGWWVVNY